MKYATSALKTITATLLLATSALITQAMAQGLDCNSSLSGCSTTNGTMSCTCNTEYETSNNIWTTDTEIITCQVGAAGSNTSNYSGSCSQQCSTICAGKVADTGGAGAGAGAGFVAGTPAGGAGIVVVNPVVVNPVAIPTGILATPTNNPVAIPTGILAMPTNNATR